MLNLIYNLKHKLTELYNICRGNYKKDSIYKKENNISKGKIRYFNLIFHLEK